MHEPIIFVPVGIRNKCQSGHCGDKSNLEDKLDTSVWVGTNVHEVQLDVVLSPWQCLTGLQSSCVFNVVPWGERNNPHITDHANWLPLQAYLDVHVVEIDITCRRTSLSQQQRTRLKLNYSFTVGLLERASERASQSAAAPQTVNGHGRSFTSCTCSLTMFSRLKGTNLNPWARMSLFSRTKDEA